ncbi:unnamed protein product [Penicillium salamii]|nr:unnamed protein product [Penicillium salamii]
MDHPISPSPCDQPAKRQSQSSHNPEDDSNLPSHHQQIANPMAIKFEIPICTQDSLTAEFMKLLQYNNSLAMPALKLLDLYFCL